MHVRARVVQLLGAWLLLCAWPAWADIVLVGTSTAANESIPTDGSPGAVTFTRPSGVGPGDALVVSIAARPRSMNVVAPAGWVQMTFTDQPDGGTATAPAGSTLVTFYKIATTSEPANYTWTFANSYNAGGMVAGVMMAYTGIDTSTGNPIDNNGAAWSSHINTAGLTHQTGSITTTTAGTLVLASITYNSASSFSPPSGISGIAEVVDLASPPILESVGITLQFSAAVNVPAGTHGPVSTTAGDYGGSADYGIGHLMALKPTQIDPALTMARSGPLNPGGSASYSLTVRNRGVMPEPGPLTAVATLPAGLTYTGASGSGWSCGAAGQTITCTRSGALAANTNAPVLQLNVSVAGGASGAYTTNASVSGTGGDGNMQNNVAVDTYVIPSARYASYAMDESAWGSVTDTSGNSHHGSKLGTAAPTGNPPPAPAGAAIAGTPGTCGAANVPDSTGAIGVATGIDMNHIGATGSIAFWYAAAQNWANGTPRILFDASNDLVSGDRHFFLAKTGTGALVFSLQDSAGTTATVTSPSYGFMANTWHHITVSWELASGTLKIYVDGTLATSGSTALNGVLGDASQIYIGSRRTSGITGTPAAYNSNSAYGLIDEWNLYAIELSAAEVTDLTTRTHTCTSGIDHYELLLPTTGLSCLAQTVEVVACADASSPCTNRATTLAGQTATLSASAGSLGNTTVTFDGSGSASTSFSYGAASNGASASITLSAEQALAGSPRRCCANGTSCSTANSCSITLNTAGFVIAAAANGAATTVATQTAGSASGSLVLRAVQTSSTTKACEAAVTGSTTVNWGYQCNNPGTCSAGNLLSLTGSATVAVPGNANGSSASSAAVTMAFDANGNAPFSFNYADVGQITLLASKPASGSLTAALSGQSNAFVVKPHRLQVSDVRCSSYTAGNCATTAIAAPGLNPGASTPAGSAFVPAGAPFSATVTAVNASGVATPNFGRETSPEAVRLTATLVAPTGGNAPALQNATAIGGFSGGSATATALAWSEVGAITLTPALDDGSYLGAGAVTGTVSGTVGRFYPHHFDLTLQPGCTASFGYAGQPSSATVRARALGGGLVVNYDGIGTYGANFAKATTLGEPTALGLGSLTGGTAIAYTGFYMGQATATPTYAFTSKTSGPGTLTLRATDADNVSSAPALGGTDGSVLLRSGRLRLSNAFGRANTALQVAVAAEYWAGTAWVPNSADTCSGTGLGVSNVAVSNPRGASGAASTATTSVSMGSWAAGRGSLVLSAPSPAGSSLSVDLALNLGGSTADQSCNAAHPATTGAGKAWLRSQNGNCSASADRDPAARASFGIAGPETTRTVHVRSLY